MQLFNFLKFFRQYIYRNYLPSTANMQESLILKELVKKTFICYVMNVRFKTTMLSRGRWQTIVGVRFSSFLSGGFITSIIVNPPERKLPKRISVQCMILSKMV